ncbi:hypothetical protein Tco_0418278 [Tanacetum coccineum]
MPAKTTKTTNHHIKKPLQNRNDRDKSLYMRNVAQHSLIDLLDVFASSLNNLISSKKRYNLDEAFNHDDSDDEDYGDEDSGDEKDVLVIYQLRNVPTFSSNSSSLDVNKTNSIGKDLGFNMEGKEPDGAKVLGTSVDNGIQESMTCDVNPFMIKSMWGHSKFEYEVNKAFGKSGESLRFGIHLYSLKPPQLQAEKELDMERLSFLDELPAVFNIGGSALVCMHLFGLHRNETSSNTESALCDAPKLRMAKFFCSAVRFKLKLQNLKKAIKSWRITVNESETAAATVLRDGIKEIDQKAKVSHLTLADVNLITNNVSFFNKQEGEDKIDFGG